MMLNKKKPALMIFKNKKHVSERKTIIKGIILVNSYKYLGITVNDSWNLDDHILTKKINFIQVFISPLFDQMYGFLFYAKAQDKDIQK